MRIWQMADIFDLQDDIAKLVLQQILQHFEKLSMGPILNVGTSSVEAYNAYLQGKYESLKFTSEALDLSIVHLRRAIRLDPKFLRARIKLIASLQSMRMTLGRSELSDVIEEEKRLLQQHDPDGRYVNWVTSDDAYENSATSVLEVHERLLARMLKHPDDSSIVGINPDRWWAGGFASDDDTKGPVESIALYGLILANSGLYRTALDYLLAAQLKSSALANIQIILGRLEAASNTLKRLIHAEPQVIIYHILYVLLYLRRAQESKEPLMPAILIWVPSMVRAEDWLRLSKRDDFRQLLDDMGVGAKWQAEMRIRATALSRESGIAMVD